MYHMNVGFAVQRILMGRIEWLAVRHATFGPTHECPNMIVNSFRWLNFRWVYERVVAMALRMQGMRIVDDNVPDVGVRHGASAAHGCDLRDVDAAAGC